MDGMTIETIAATPDAKGNVSIPVEGIAPATNSMPAELSFKPNDLMSDLAKIQAEQNPAPLVPQTPVVEPVKAVEPGQPATAPVTPVPDKFKNPDGTVNQEKIEKSTVNAEEAYQKYAEIERKMRQAQNSVAALKQGAPVPAVPVAAPAPMQLTPFEIQVAQDLINEAAAAGYQMPQGQAIAQARVQVRLMEAKHNAEATRIEQIGQRLEDQDRRRELEKIAEHDPWVISPEGIETLGKIRESRPHVNASPTPWTSAYREFLADRVMSERLNGTVQTPTPTALTAKAPPTPVNAAPRVVVKPAEPNMASKSAEEISAYVATLSPKEEAAFWAKRGLKF